MQQLVQLDATIVVSFIAVELSDINIVFLIVLGGLLLVIPPDPTLEHFMKKLQLFTVVAEAEKNNLSFAE